MAVQPNDEPEKLRPIDWPAEWWVDEKFWREVATRTVAGMLAIVLLGSPALIVAAAFGTIGTNELWAIFIGAGLFLAVIAIYLGVYQWTSWSRRKKTERLERQILFNQRLIAQLELARTGDIDLTVNRDKPSLERMIRLWRRQIERSRLQNLVIRLFAIITASIGAVTGTASIAEYLSR